MWFYRAVKTVAASLMVTTCVPVMAQSTGSPDIAVTTRILASPGGTGDPEAVSSWYPGEQFSIEVTAVNEGSTTATGDLTITLPSEFSTSGGGYSTSGSLAVTGDLPDLTLLDVEPGASVVFSYQGTIATGSYTFSAATTTPGDLNPSNDESQSLLEVVNHPQADIEANITVTEPTVEWGNISTFNLTFTNNGPDVAKDLVVICQSPDNFWGAALSVTCSHGTPEEGNSRVYFVPSLGVGETVNMTATFIAVWPDICTNYAYTGLMDWHVKDPDLTNNFAEVTQEVTYDVPEYDLVATLKASPASAQPDGLLVYTMGVTNLGPDDATTISLVNYVGDFFFNNPNLTLLSIEDAGPWETQLNNPFLYANLSSLAADESATISVVCRVAPDATGNNEGKIVNSFRVTSFWEGHGELASWNNTAATMTPVVQSSEDPGTDMLVTRTSSHDTAIINQPVTYTVKGMNLGPNPASSAYLGSLLPEGMDIISAASDKGTAVVTGQYVDVSDMPLAVSEIVTLTITAVPTELGVATSQMAAASDEFDPDIDNNMAEINTMVAASTDCADLAAMMGKVKAKAKFKKKTAEWKFSGQVQVLVSNQGEQCAPETVVHLYLSDDEILDGSDALVGSKAVKPICPGKKAKKTKLKVKLAPDQDPRGRYFIAVVDGDEALAECNEENNMAVGQ